MNVSYGYILHETETTHDRISICVCVCLCVYVRVFFLVVLILFALICEHFCSVCVRVSLCLC